MVFQLNLVSEGFGAVFTREGPLGLMDGPYVFIQGAFLSKLFFAVWADFWLDITMKPHMAGKGFLL